MEDPHDLQYDPAEEPVDVPFDVVRTARIELGVTDLAASRHFYVDALGFQVTEESGDELYLRGLEETVHHSLVLRAAPVAQVQRVGYRVRQAEDLPRIAEHFDALGCPVQMEAGPPVAGLGARVLAVDPLGYPVEFFHEMAPGERLLQRFDLYRGAEVMRIDHLNFLHPQPDAGRRHYRTLGFRTTELIAGEDGTEYGIWMTRKPLVHDIAMTRGDGPRLHHVGFTVSDRLAIFGLCDVLGAMHLERHIERGPGRHGVSNAFYLYLRDPDGHRVEFYVGDYYTGDPDLRPLRWDVRDHRRRSFWGHAVVPSWYAEGSLIAAPDGTSLPVHPSHAAESVAEFEVIA